MLQSAYREGLRWGCIILTEFFIAWTLMQYVVKEREYLKYQKWIGVAILTAALIYVVIAVFTDREELRRIGAFLKSMCSFEQIMLILIMLCYRIFQIKRYAKCIADFCIIIFFIWIL